MQACEVLSSGPADTAALARSLAPQLAAGDVVLLVGALASGKTTFVQAVAQALGYAEAVTSPTFTLANFYPAPGLTVLHIDTYRLSGVPEFNDLGLVDFMDDAVTLIEWGDLVAGEFPDPLRLEFRVDGGDGRRIAMSSTGERWAPVIERLGTLKVAR
jgi:tRNA threonylcarbamoyladenosine biosynthesis protein TsaE